MRLAQLVRSTYAGLVLAAVACSAPVPQRSGLGVAPKSCQPDSSGVADSTYLVRQAQRALADMGLTVASFTVVTSNHGEQGVVISLVDIQSVGGGGLVWVDFDTDCPIVLKGYE